MHLCITAGDGAYMIIWWVNWVDGPSILEVLTGDDVFIRLEHGLEVI